MALTAATRSPDQAAALPARRRAVVALLGAVVAIAVVAAGTVGSVPISPSTVAGVIASAVGLPVERTWDEATAAIVLEIRLPRVLLAALVGAGLAQAGAVLQGIFRNPLADPYVIGVSAGAGLGATLAIVLNLNLWLLGLSAVPLLAFAGAVATTLLVYQLARLGAPGSVESLLLAGVATTAFLSGVISLLLLTGPYNLQRALFWLMGGFSGRGWEHVGMALPYVALGQVVVLAHARDLNGMLFGDEQARQLGIDVSRARAVLVGAACLMAAAAVATSGLIAFVGLVVPHMVRLLVGPDYRWMLLGAPLAGAVTLVAADVAARTVVSPAELPVGVLTALLGAPFFLYLLRRRRQRL